MLCFAEHHDSKRLIRAFSSCPHEVQIFGTLWNSDTNAARCSQVYMACVQSHHKEYNGQVKRPEWVATIITVISIASLAKIAANCAPPVSRACYAQCGQHSVPGAGSTLSRASLAVISPLPVVTLHNLLEHCSWLPACLPGFFAHNADDARFSAERDPQCYHVKRLQATPKMPSVLLRWASLTKRTNPGSFWHYNKFKA